MLFRSLIAALALTASVVKGTGVTPVSTDVTAKFTVCADVIVKLGPSFQDACKKDKPDDIVHGLINVHASLLDLSAHIDAGVGVWADADIKVFVGLYVNLMVKLQALLKIIVAGGQTDSCRSSLLALSDPLKVVLSVFINAGIDVDATIGAHVDLDVLATVGISLGIQANVGVGASV
ncbi:hypothetical protein CROQUDRAFT_107252 [Cronartium quercuum f. sp. fusiforme G11]|uniref:Uncharacterized protein n=1 Tax=Cronartium quercuum f. sp. fusiforme G11 TaxID=708437 RepID=A0A9P6TC11_9BASI|nr:hypothetical protein CROQUDRAFT_107252 [Cronartium quercuum f. sp. fusiforme G11]